MKNIAWDLYQLFLSVARHNGLTGASAVTGLSPATVGRRMLVLEEALGRPLFVRSQTGYSLTEDGSALFDKLKDMEAAARLLESWQAEGRSAPLVRLMAGTWIGLLISENMPALCSERDGFHIELTVAEQRAALAHREHDIGIRAFRPEEPNLAAQPFGECAYAPFRLRNSGASLSRMVAVSADSAISSYLLWPHQNHPDRIAITVSRPRSLMDLVRAGAGAAILPCFAGDLDSSLERAGPEIASLRHGQWIVMNNDDRHRREIRTVADRLAKLLKSHTDLFAGKRPGRDV